MFVQNSNHGQRSVKTSVRNFFTFLQAVILTRVFSLVCSPLLVIFCKKGESLSRDHLSFFCSNGVQAYLQQYDEILTIDVINNNWIDAKYCQMVLRSVLVYLPEILEEPLVKRKQCKYRGLCLHSAIVLFFFQIYTSFNQ